MRTYQCDAREVPSGIGSGSVQCTVTSPPYFGRRAYGDDPSEIGRGDLHVYVKDIVQVFRGVARVLAHDGVAWLNIGDTASGSGGAGGDYNDGGSKDGKPKYRQGRCTVETADLDLFGGPILWVIPDGQWCDVPGLVAHALRRDGWLVRADIAWNKMQRRPEDLSHVRRPGESSERIFMLTRSMGYRFFPERLEETGDVWSFKPGGDGPSHLAPFPDELARRCILPCTEPGDLVFDPFSGSHTTCRVAEELGRRGVGCDLYAETIML